MELKEKPIMELKDKTPHWNWNIKHVIGVETENASLEWKVKHLVGVEK